MSKIDRPEGASARKVRRIGHLDLPGAGQVTVAGHFAYVGHIPNAQQLSTSIIDVADPANPRLVASITLDDPTSHSHKVRVAGDLMLVNHERNRTTIGRRAEQLPGVRRVMHEALGRDPTCTELAEKLNVTEASIIEIQAAERQAYNNGGFRIYDVANPQKPRLIHHHKTGGIGVHRFDMDERYAYISTEMAGFIGNIWHNDLRDPAHPDKKCRVGGCQASTSRVARHRLGQANGIRAAPCAALRK